MRFSSIGFEASVRGRSSVPIFPFRPILEVIKTGNQNICLSPLRKFSTLALFICRTHPHRFCSQIQNSNTPAQPPQMPGLYPFLSFVFQSPMDVPERFYK